jgi:hypothetical protein
MIWKSSLVGLVAVGLMVGAISRRGSSGGTEKDAPEKAADVAPQAEADRPVPEAAAPAREATPAPAANLTVKAEDRRQLLETVGALTAAHAFQTYLNLGLIADSKAKGTYSDRDARKLLDSVMDLQNIVDKKLTTLSKIDLDKEDAASLEDMRTLSDLLRKQRKELEAFWDSGKPEDEARYENVRKDSWAALSKLMGGR